MWRFLILLFLTLAAASYVIWRYDLGLIENGPELPGPGVAPAANGSPTIERPLYGTEGSRPTSSPLRPAQGQVFFDPVIIPDCVLSSMQVMEVSSQLEGVIAELRAVKKQPVTRGQVLAVLKTDRVKLVEKLQKLKATSELAEKLAKARLDQAEEQVRIDDGLRLKGGVTGDEWRLHKFQRDAADLEVKKAVEDRESAGLELLRVQHELSLHEIKSELTGEVIDVPKNPGELVKPQDLLFRVVNNDRLRIDGLCTSEQADLLREGMRCLVEPEAPSPRITRLHGHTAIITGLAVSPDGQWVASASEDQTVILWSWPQPGRRIVLTHPTEVHAVALSVDIDAEGKPLGWHILTGGGDGRARLWSVGPDGKLDEKVLAFEAKHQGIVRAVAFSPDGRWCASGGADKRIYLWETDTGRCLYELAESGGFRSAAHRGEVTALHFTPDGHLISAAEDKTLKVWKLGENAGALVRQVSGRKGDIAQLGVSGDGQRLLLDHGEELRIIDREHGDTLGVVRGRRQGNFQALALLSPNGRNILTCLANSRLQLWQTPVTPEQDAFFRQGYARGLRRNTLSAFGVLTARLTPGGVPALAAWSAAAAPQPAVPAIAGMEGVGKAVVPELWNLQAHVARYYALPDNCIVTCGAFAPDESVFFTGGTDNLVHVWAVPAPGEASRLLEAQVTFVGSQVEGGTGLVQIQAELENPSDPARRLRPGSRVHLTLYPETGRRKN